MGQASVCCCAEGDRRRERSLLYEDISLIGIKNHRVTRTKRVRSSTVPKMKEEQAEKPQPQEVHVYVHKENSPTTVTKV